MPKLSVNIDHVATIRQARRTIEPDPIAAAIIAELAGTHGITVHLREDRRHIQDRDLYILKQVVQTELNLEMAATEEMAKIALDVKPDMVTLVPEKREELTTEEGLNVIEKKPLLIPIINMLKDKGIAVSVFIDPDSKQIEEVANIKAEFIELHTGNYANIVIEEEREKELKKLQVMANLSKKIGLRINAGHGLTYRNVVPIAKIPEIEKLAIGHAIISKAVLVGLKEAIKEMLILIA